MVAFYTLPEDQQRGQLSAITEQTSSGASDHASSNDALLLQQADYFLQLSAGAEDSLPKLKNNLKKGEKKSQI